MTALKYESNIDLAADNAHTRVIGLVGTGKRVLDLGCASGSLGKVLIEQFGCVVTGIERDAEAAELARGRGLRVVDGDLDTIDLVSALGKERFEVALCADVLEHLRDPGRTLRALGELLGPGGYLVASVPNVAHISIVAELLEGRFSYRSCGLLDETHLRFFTRHTLLACLREAGFAVTHLERVCQEPEQTEFRTDLSRFPRDVEAMLRSREEATTYQFIVRAEPALTAAFDLEPAPDNATSPEQHAERRTKAEAARLWMRFLEEERGQQRRELDQLRELVARLQGSIRERDARLTEAHAKLLRQAADIDALTDMPSRMTGGRFLARWWTQLLFPISRRK